MMRSGSMTGRADRRPNPRRQTPDFAASWLIALHGWLAHHPRVHSLLMKFYDRMVGERLARRSLLALVRPGDCVWDVGANLGSYTRPFLERVGLTGHVVAVEPVPGHLEHLRRLAPADRLTVVPVALADSEAVVSFLVNGQASRIADGPSDLLVRQTSGDALVAEGIRPPDVLKLDVEGAEGDALRGMESALAAARAVLIEIHFAILTRQGRSDEPDRILRLLRSHGFTLRWTDSSHLQANRLES